MIAAAVLISLLLFGAGGALVLFLRRRAAARASSRIWRGLGVGASDSEGQQLVQLGDERGGGVPGGPAAVTQPPPAGRQPAQAPPGSRWAHRETDDRNSDFQEITLLPATTPRSTSPPFSRP